MNPKLTDRGTGAAGLAPGPTFCRMHIFLVISFDVNFTKIGSAEWQYFLFLGGEQSATFQRIVYVSYPVYLRL